jgi:hypothetical protein
MLVELANQFPDIPFFLPLWFRRWIFCHVLAKGFFFGTAHLLEVTVVHEKKHAHLRSLLSKEALWRHPKENSG